jgi:hypothetical protein
VLAGLKGAAAGSMRWKSRRRMLAIGSEYVLLSYCDLCEIVRMRPAAQLPMLQLGNALDNCTGTIFSTIAVAWEESVGAA